jgi:hypothetical protein
MDKIKQQQQQKLRWMTCMFEPSLPVSAEAPSAAAFATPGSSGSVAIAAAVAADFAPSVVA